MFLLLSGGTIAPFVYLGMVGALLVSYTRARVIPLSVMGRALEWLGLSKASRLVLELDAVAPDKRLNALSAVCRFDHRSLLRST